MNTTLRTIRVRGTLAKLLKRRTFKAAVRSPQEAIRFLLANYPELEGYMRPRFFHISVGERVIDEESIGLPTGFYEDINITPAICGAGGPVGQVITGLALITLSIFVPFVAPVLLPLGIGLTLTGVAGLLSPVTPDRPESSDARDSYSFNGLQQTSREGPPVPLVYGEIITGSIVLSVNVERDDEELGTGDGEGIFEPGIGDNTYNLNERYPGVCWIYYSEVYLKFDDACSNAPGAAGKDRTVFGKWGEASRGDYGGWQTATAPSGENIIIPTNCNGSQLKGYDNFTYDVLIDCAGANQTNNPPYQNRPGTNTFLGGFGSAGLYPIGYRIWQGPIPPEASFHQQNPSLYANVPYRLIASTAVAGNTLPTANLPNVYPNNPFE
jgi:predicted phage tail protein